jgi:hypothetical protein
MPQEKFDLDEALEDEATPAGLRKWAEQVQQQNKKLADELATFKASQRTNTITGALQTLGVPAKIAAFYPADADASPEAVGKWLKDHEGVFAVSPAKTDDDKGGGGETPPGGAAEPTVPVDVIAAMRAIQETVPVTSGTPTLADRAAEIDKLPMRTPEDRAKLDAFEGELMQLARASQSAWIGSMQR